VRYAAATPIEPTALNPTEARAGAAVREKFDSLNRDHLRDLPGRVRELDTPRPPVVGDRVRIERDETRYPSKGTWPQFRGRIGTIVEVNVDRKHPHLTEYGVALAKVSARTDGRGAFNWDASSVAWFKVYEIVRVAPERHAEANQGISEGESAGDAFADTQRERVAGLLGGDR
jgi:hypothetical protein